MNYMLRLYLFEFLHGNRIAIGELVNNYGLLSAVRITTKLKFRVWFANPFQEINLEKQPTAEERASQHQMAPAIVLYDLLKEMGLSEEQAIADLQSLIITVATEFLKFNVPIIKQSDYVNTDKNQRMKYFKVITSRFFNAEGELSQTGDSQMNFKVNKCQFARYSRDLGYPQLAKVFCSADKHFFDLYQPNIEFGRTVTLAEHQTPCDFSFTVRLEHGR